MGKDALKRGFAVGAVLALGAAPAALADQPADPGSQGHGHGHASGQSKAGGKTVMFVFKGSYSGGGDVVVEHGNAHVRKAGLVGTTVSFDLSNAKIVVADNNGDQVKDLTDVANDDRVVVKSRLPRTDPGSQPFAAKQLVDQTHASSP